MSMNGPSVAITDPESEKCDFPIPHIFIGPKPLKMPARPCAGAAQHVMDGAGMRLQVNTSSQRSASPLGPIWPQASGRNILTLTLRSIMMS